MAYCDIFICNRYFDVPKHEDAGATLKNACQNGHKEIVLVIKRSTILMN